MYLFRTNNTKAIAEFIHQKVGGTMVALELETPYPADYNATVQQNETDYLPPLKTKIDRIEQYDFVFVGFPPSGHERQESSSQTWPHFLFSLCMRECAAALPFDELTSK